MARYYNSQAEIVETVMGGGGKPRQPTIADVKKKGGSVSTVLLPSVTTVLKVMANDWLAEWKIKEMLKTAFDIAQGMTDKEKFIETVVSQFDDNSNQVMDDGKDIHKAVENALNGEDSDPKYAKHVNTVLGLLSQCRGTVYSEVPMALPMLAMDHGTNKDTWYGVAGTMDLFIDPTGFPLKESGLDVTYGNGDVVDHHGLVLDLKTVSKHPSKLYESWIIQTSAYAWMLSAKARGFTPVVTSGAKNKAISGNLYLTPEPGLTLDGMVIKTGVITIERESGTAMMHQISDDQIRWGVKVFKEALNLWVVKNKIL
jgi:hypothetical protein